MRQPHPTLKNIVRVNRPTGKIRFLHPSDFFGQYILWKKIGRIQKNRMDAKKRIHFFACSCERSLTRDRFFFYRVRILQVLKILDARQDFLLSCKNTFRIVFWRLQGRPEGDVPLHADPDQRQEDRLVAWPRKAFRVHDRTRRGWLDKVFYNCK
jgi:hypothetical protein